MQRANLIRLVIAAVVLCAVAVSYVYRERAGRAPADAQEAEAISNRAAANAGDMQQALSDAISQKLVSEEQARMDSPLGQALSRMCAEWTDFHESHPSEDTAARRDAACRDLRRWVNDGETPPGRDGSQPQPISSR